jgi:drug/metabolite transporter (DMT)-like permease
MSSGSVLTPRVLVYLILPTILWAGNAIVGRLAVGAISPILLNTLRWALAALILLPIGWRLLKSGSPIWRNKIRFLWLGLLGVGSYNALLYLSLETSTPINVTLIGGSMPMWMLLIGALFYQQAIQWKQMLGALISLFGVMLVLSRGDLSTLLNIQLVLGDLYILLATILWAFYSWMLSHPGKSSEREWPWAEFLLAQVLFGVVWSSAFLGVEWALDAVVFHLTSETIALLIFVAIAPSLIAYRCWGLGVTAAGPAMASFFANLIPLFTALMSAALLGEPPKLFHGLAFVMIVAGIIISSRKKSVHH